MQVGIRAIRGYKFFTLWSWVRLKLADSGLLERSCMGYLYGRKKDLNQIVSNIARLTTGSEPAKEVAKNPAAVALGRLGGLKGGKQK